jgi:hypothetical protein
MKFGTCGPVNVLRHGKPFSKRNLAFSERSTSSFAEVNQSQFDTIWLIYQSRTDAGRLKNALIRHASFPSE